MKTKVNVVSFVGIMCLWISGISFGGLIAHYDGSQITTSGNEVVSWDNQGSSGDAVADFESGRPTISSVVMPNGTTRTVLNFDGIDDHLTIASDEENFDGDSFTWFMVLKANSNDTNKVTLRSAYQEGCDRNKNAMWGDFLSTNGAVYSMGRDLGGNFKSRASALSLGDWHIVVGAWGSDMIRQWLDTVYSGGTTTGVTAEPALHTMTRIGADTADTPGGCFDGQIAEIRIYNDNMIGSTNDLRLSIEEELMNTYLVPEPTALVLLGAGFVSVLRRKKH